MKAITVTQGRPYLDGRPLDVGDVLRVETPADRSRVKGKVVHIFGQGYALRTTYTDDAGELVEITVPLVDGLRAEAAELRSRRAA